MPASAALCPAGISSFFEVCNTDTAGNVLADPARIGVRGGGFGIRRGVSAFVNTRKDRKVRVQIRINSELAPEARTTGWAVEEILRRNGVSLNVHIDLKLSVPMKAGFGTSAAGTLASCLALIDAADLPLTLNEIGWITHVAEVINGTGLGTTSALLTGGFVLVTEPGAPGIGVVDRMRFPKDHSLLCGYLGPISTRDVLAQPDVAGRVNAAAQLAMAGIRSRPEVRTFLDEASRFSKTVGFQTENVTRLAHSMISLGAVGATQNMLGEAVHGVVQDDIVNRVLRDLRKAFPSASLFASRLDERGVRLMDPRNPKH